MKLCLCIFLMCFTPCSFITDQQFHMTSEFIYMLHLYMLDICSMFPLLPLKPVLPSYQGILLLLISNWPLVICLLTGASCFMLCSHFQDLYCHPVLVLLSLNTCNNNPDITLYLLQKCIKIIRTVSATLYIAQLPKAKL